MNTKISRVNNFWKFLDRRKKQNLLKAKWSVPNSTKANMTKAR